MKVMENADVSTERSTIVFVDFQKKKKLNSNSVPTTKNNDFKRDENPTKETEKKHNVGLCDILNMEEYIDMSAKNAYASLLMSLEEDGWNSEHFRILEYVNEQIEELKYVLKFVLKLEKYGK